MTSHLDSGIGQVLAALKAKDIDKNTVVVFMSDNGGNEDAGADNGILRGGKGTVYEGGVRVPAVVYWPEHTTGKHIFSGPVFAQDWLPTLLEAANVKNDNNFFDGRSVLASLMSTNTELSMKNVVLGAKGSHAVFNWPWKLVAAKNSEYKLFNVQEDPTESNNVYSQYPDRVAVMTKVLLSLPKEESKGVKGNPPRSLFNGPDGRPDHNIRLSETRQPWADAAK
jgi:arylsulfatase A-like enzyme